MRNDEAPSKPAAASTDRIAVLIPCLNEAATIDQVVRAFAAEMPDAEIVVCDNGSTDDTAEIARRAGARVITEARKGKGAALRRLFRAVSADAYIIVDGDLTYDASFAPTMVRAMKEHDLDVVLGARKNLDEDAYRFGHAIGNKLLTGAINFLFNASIRDMLSGYRIMSDRFIRTFPCRSEGFEVETELSVHMLELKVAYQELETEYRARPPSSQSKLRTVRDGIAIARMILTLLVQESPARVFCGCGAVLLLTAAAFFAPVFAEYLATGLVPRFPTLVGAASLGIIGVVSIFSGLILSGVAEGRREAKAMMFNSLKAKRLRRD